MYEIGCFVSSHGFGHATRMAAVLEALAEKVPIKPHIFATTGAELFHQSLESFSYHHLLSDLGLVQANAFDIDIAATSAELQKLLPYDSGKIEQLAGICRNCCCIISDISAMGIEVAHRIAVPAVLIENFTWDLIYAPYFHQSDTLRQAGRYLEHLYAGVDIHIQTEPLCRPANCDFRCRPIARRFRSERSAIRLQLRPGGRKVVLISLGGIPFYPQFISALERWSEFFFLVTGQRENRRVGKNIELMTPSSLPYHPDLINGADIAVFKCGYSTMAECYQAGTSAICIRRQGFAESAALEQFAEERMAATLISQEEFSSGRWLDLLPDQAGKRRTPPTINGADQVAHFLCSHLFLNESIPRKDGR